MVNLRIDDVTVDSSSQNNFEHLPVHPLLIDHIVETILEYADSNHERDCRNGILPPGNSLLSYRLVCKLWNEIATKLYRSKNQQVEVGSYSTSVPKFRKLIKIQKTNPYQGCNTKPKRSKPNYNLNWSSPFVKFRLCQEVFQPLYSSIITDFFQTFQDSLEVLDIWLDLRSTLHDIPLHSKSRLSSFPNLKTLVYDDRRVVLEGRKDVRGSLLKNLVELAPNIQRLQIRFQRDYRGSVECGSEVVLKNLRCLFSSQTLQKSLKDLRLDLHLNDQLFTCLHNATSGTGNLRLESLELAIRGSSFSFLSLRNLLESLKNSLRKLKLNYIERDSHCLISFPRMNVLKEFEVDGTDSFSKHSVSLGDFTFSECLPHLHSLKINIWAQSHLKWNQFFPTRSVVYSITELKLPGELCDVSMISCVSRAFPNMRKLTISVYSATLQVLGLIFERMGELEELTVTKFPSLWDRNEKNIDDILTGINGQDCDKLWRDNVALNAVTDDELLVLKTRAGLIDLKKLKRLSMPDLQYQASYTDITGYLAFQRMPSLRFLNVGRSYMSTGCLMLLVHKFPEMEAQRKLPPGYFKEPEEDDDGSFLELPGDTCVYL